MKTKFILFLFLLFSAGMYAQEVKRVAILETVDKENKISYANKLILRASLSKAITQTEGYEAYDRTDVDAIMSEQDFQRTGMVSNDQIKRLGEMTGANYILVAEAAQLDDKKTMFITAKLLDVETARTIMTDYVMMGTTADQIQEGCTILSEKLFSNRPTSKTSSKVAAIASTSQIPEMDAKMKGEEKLVINSKSTQKMFGVKKYSYGGNQMDEKQFVQFLYRNNTKIYADYVKSKKLISAGWWTMGTGIVSMFGLGMGCLFANDRWRSTSYGGYYYTSDEAMAVGFTFISLGAAATAASIPIVSVGYAKKKKVAYSLNNDLYVANNPSTTSKPAVNLSVQSSQNGIGLALNF